MDINGFKAINDEHGHHIGDQVLFEFARRLRGACRKTEVPYRYGGDEFVAICENLDSPGQLQVIQQRILNAVNGEYVTGRHRLFVSASIGASADDSPHTAPAKLLAEADAQMYVNKKEEAVRENRDVG